MASDMCPRCRRVACRCKSEPTMLDWQDGIAAISRRRRSGKNVVSLDAYRHRRDWNRHVRENWEGDDHAA